MKKMSINEKKAYVLGKIVANKQLKNKSKKVIKKRKIKKDDFWSSDISKMWVFDDMRKNNKVVLSSDDLAKKKIDDYNKDILRARSVLKCKGNIEQPNLVPNELRVLARKHLKKY